jgi:hypothetical protein
MWAFSSIATTSVVWWNPCAIALADDGVVEDKTTDMDRAIDALTREGVRIYRDPTDSVFGIMNITRDGQLAFAEHLPTLRSIRISGNEVTDAGVESLVKLKQLSSLTISRTSITDVGLRKLKALPSLTRLSLSGGDFTIEGLRQLKHVPKLRRLSLLSSIDESKLQFLKDVPQIDSPILKYVRFGAMADRPVPRDRSQIRFIVNSETGRKSAHLQTRLTSKQIEQLK